MVLGSRIMGGIVKGLTKRYQVYFTDKSIVVVQTPRIGGVRLNVLRLGDSSTISGWKPEEDISSFMDELDKRKKFEIPLEQLSSIELTKPKRGLILKGKPGYIKFHLADGNIVELKIDVETTEKEFEEMVRLVNELFPGKVKVMNQ